jgi:3-hydroxyisobutyrate dehydrogenase
VLETDGEDVQTRDQTCFFSAAHAAKDSGIALELARSLGLDLPLAGATKEQYDRMVAEGLGELGKSNQRVFRCALCVFAKVVQHHSAALVC